MRTGSDLTSDRIPILELVRSLEYGGRTVRILEGVAGYTRYGFDATIASFAAPLTEMVKRFPALEGCISLGLSHKCDPRQVVRIHRLIRQRRIALIHAHSEDACLYGGLAAFINRIPIIGTFHRSTPESYSLDLRSRLCNRLLTH